MWRCVALKAVEEVAVVFKDIEREASVSGAGMSEAEE